MIIIDKWAGLVTNASPYAIPPGAAVTQVNMQCLSPGQLNVRPGLQAVTFASTVSATQSIISAFNYQRSVSGGMVYQDAVGNVYTVSVPAGGLPPSFSGVPGIPRNLAATAGNGSAALDWDEPEFSGGGGVAGYSIQRSSDGGTTWTFAASASSTAATISGLANGTTYVFRVASTNQYGIGNYTAASNSVTPIGAPGSPTNLSATAGNAQAVLSWSAPANDGGSAVTDYVVQYSGDGGATWATFADGASAAPSATITGLANGSPYVFRVAASNPIGTSAYVAWMTPISPLGVPDQVGAVTATHGNESVSLLWSAPPANHQGGITDYAIQQSTDGGTSWTTLSDGTNADTSYTVTGLANGTSYRYRVAAINAVGTGPYSSATSTVIPRTVPGAPTALTGTAGNAQVELSWASPASNGGAAITDYKIEVSVNSGAYTVITKAASAATSYTATGLANGTSYRFRVSAVNSEGAGATVTGSILTPQTVPLAPTNVTGTSGDGLSIVRWTAPTSDGGSAITDYVIQYSTNSGSTWTTYSDGSSTNTQVSVTGLTNGTSYLFRVAASSSVGTGNYSSASAAVIPVGAPGAPTAVTVTGGNGNITASWTAPANNGGASITGYVIQVKQTSASAWSTYGTVPGPTSAVIAGLINGREYVVRVAAVNDRNFTGAYSAQSSAVYPGRVPAAPTSLSVTARTVTNESTNTVTLQWTLPDTYGSTITTHAVQFRETGTSQWYDVVGGRSAANTCVITNELSAAKIYDFRVATVSTVGPGPYSSVLSGQAVSVAPTGLTLTSVASAGYVTITWAVSSAGTGVLSASALENDIEFANAVVDLTARTVIIPTGAAGSRTFTVRVGNFAGSLTANATVTAQAGTVTTAPVFRAPSWEEGRMVQEIVMPTVGVDDSDTLLLEVSTDSGTTWSTIGEHTGVLHPTTIKYKRNDQTMPTPSTTIRHWDRRWGLHRYYIAKPPSVPFLLRASASSAGGSAVTGTPTGVTASITAPGTYSDSAWARVAFLYDTQGRKSVVRERNGALTTTLINSTAPQPTGTGRFGDAYITEDTPYLYRAFSTAGAAATPRPRYDYGTDDVLTCEAWSRMTIPSGTTARYLWGVQRTGNALQGVTLNSTSFKYTPVVNENQRGTSNPEHGHVFVDAELRTTPSTTTPYRLIVRAYTNEFAGSGCVTNQGDYIRRDYTLDDAVIDEWVHIAVEFSQKKLFYSADNTIRVYINGRLLTAVASYSSWASGVPAADRTIRNSSNTWPCATHGCTNGAACPHYDNTYFPGSRGIAFTSAPTSAGSPAYFMHPNSFQYLETLRITAGGRYFGEFTPPERTFSEPS